jgi:hypothetical protein
MVQETFKELTLEQFDEQFPLVPNHLDDNASWQDEDGQGFMFETFDEELAFVKAQDPRKVFTIVDADKIGRAHV